MQYKVTKQHFEYYKKRCRYWRNVFGLKNWQFYYKHDDMEDDFYSACSQNLSGYVATMFLNKHRNWPVTKDSLDYSALHEVIHLCLARMSTNGKIRFVQQSELEEAEEEAVRTLCDVIRSRDGKGK